MADNVITGFHLVKAHTMGTSFVSAVQQATYQDNIGVQFLWTGTPTGTFGVQISNDYNPGTGVGTFTSITLATIPTASGSAGSYALALFGFPFCYYQVVYTATGGAGVADVWVSGKGV